MGVKSTLKVGSRLIHVTSFSSTRTMVQTLQTNSQLLAEVATFSILFLEQRTGKFPFQNTFYTFLFYKYKYFFFTKFVFFRLKFRSMHIIMHFLYFINYTKTLYITLPLCSQDHHNNSILFLSRIYQWCSIPRLHIQHDTR